MQQVVQSAGLNCESLLCPSTRPKEELNNLLKKAVEVLTSCHHVMLSTAIMLRLRSSIPILLGKQIDLLIWAMISDNLESELTKKQIRAIIRKSKPFVATEEFEEYHKKILAHIREQFKTDKDNLYTSLPAMLKAGKKHPESRRMEVD